jgi:predicted Fe-Mo cluster-binding NifX family protein
MEHEFEVRLIGDPTHPKRFRAFADAKTFAETRTRSGEVERAEIYKVNASQNEAPVLISVISLTPSDEEIQRERQREIKIARGRGPKALLKALGLPVSDVKIKRRL